MEVWERNTGKKRSILRDSRGTWREGGKRGSGEGKGERKARMEVRKEAREEAKEEVRERDYTLMDEPLGEQSSGRILYLGYLWPWGNLSSFYYYHRGGSGVEDEGRRESKNLSPCIELTMGGRNFSARGGSEKLN